MKKSTGVSYVLKVLCQFAETLGVEAPKRGSSEGKKNQFLCEY